MIVPDGARLDAGDPFPSLSLTLAGGDQLRAPEEFDHPFQVLLFYRGHWCSYCQSQLTSFQSGLAKLEAEGIGVLAASVDDEAHSAATIESLGLTFLVAHSLPLTTTAQAIGAFTGAPQGEYAADRPPYLQSTGFLVGPDRRVLVSVYSSGAIGRLGWQDVLGMVRYAKQAAAR